ncbi:hypothetical protein B0A49_04835 [Cryomyces minteri]|uniref:ATP-dependent RNA helicase n=1 Tax=Cryomyces minteri TaxID=331657 RepID=A0A4U0WPB6_9PEZI|nr:hypothetical protein B0A49_04835 [Cryomyces minteri]
MANPQAVYSTAMLREANAQTYKSMQGKLQAPLLRALDNMGYEYMTPVQSQVLSGLPSMSSDCLVQAKTGTGKTIAFLLPALQSLLTGPRLPSGQVGILVMSPTRELALQIAKECDQLTPLLPQRVECHTAFGGTQRATNLNRFMTGSPTVLVATPGRLGDYLGEPKVRAKFSDMRTLILDEADTMLEQGFLAAITDILKQLPPKSKGWQGMCFSATIPAKIKDVFYRVLKPGYTHISTVDANEPPTVDRVPQFSVVVPTVKDTFNALAALIQLEYKQSPEDFKIIVFGTTANGVALLAAAFDRLVPGIKVFQLQSRLNQARRTRTTDEFKAASSGIMFASDVIGRGMDFPNVGLVIQVGLPSSGEQYVHRVGRTARAGNDGRAVILLTQAESYFLHVNKQLPIKPYPQDVMAQAKAMASAMESKFNGVDEETKRKAYSAWLGFHKVYTKQLQMNLENMVKTANEYAYAMGCPEAPMVDKRIVGKMGFKGVPGLRVGEVGGEKPRRFPQQSRGVPTNAMPSNNEPSLNNGPSSNKRPNGNSGPPSSKRQVHTNAKPSGDGPSSNKRPNGTDATNGERRRKR